jgi:predicted DNA-binding transcriptional regulator AlpA
MKLRLHSLDQAPKTVPLWDAILEDLGDPSADRIAKLLGVSRSTVYRWKAAQEAPKCAALALFWLTKWGQSHVNAQAVNDAAMACNYVEVLQSEVKTLRRQVDKLTRINHTGAANGPLMRLPL